MMWVGGPSCNVGGRTEVLIGRLLVLSVRNCVNLWLNGVEGVLRMLLVNPMNETPARAVAAPRRLASLAGKSVGLLDISKPGGSVFLDRLERLLAERYSVARVVREMKPTFTKPAPDDVINRLRAFDAVIEGLAD